MKLTREKAIELVKERWAYLAETGGYEEDWPGDEKYGRMVDFCPSCEYGERQKEDYDTSPYDWTFRSLKWVFTCCGNVKPHLRWCNSNTVKGRKKAALNVLKQLEKLFSKGK